jgi:hypothetical protein
VNSLRSHGCRIHALLTIREAIGAIGGFEGSLQRRVKVDRTFA